MNKQTKLSTLIECGECQLWMMHSLSGTRKTSSHWASLPTPLPSTCRLASVICLRPYIMVLGEQNCLQKEKKQFYFAGQKQALHRSKMGKREGWWIQTLQMKVSHREQRGLCWRLVMNTILSKWEAPLTFIFLPYQLIAWQVYGLCPLEIPPHSLEISFSQKAISSSKAIQGLYCKTKCFVSRKVQNTK